MHAALKQETAHLHRRLNTLPNARVLVTSRIDPSSYGAILLAFAKAYSHLEDAIIQLEEKVDLGIVQKYTPRLVAIRHDITSLHKSVALNYGRRDAVVSGGAPAHDLARYLGLRYVIDGSTQGGAFIARRLRKTLPELTQNAFAFWTVQEEAAACWPGLCETIDRVGSDPEEFAQMLNASRSAFSTFIDCFVNSE